LHHLLRVLFTQQGIAVATREDIFSQKGKKVHTGFKAKEELP
jgi:hypothetical protein